MTWKRIGLSLGLASLFFASAQGQCSNPKDFLCKDGGCIAKDLLCDGSRECHDGSDETADLCRFRACSKSLDYEDADELDLFAVPNLGQGEVFRCNYGACISKRFICDGIKHCIADGSDETEKLCGPKTCPNAKFRCGYGACLFLRSVCDNRYHCFDHSDESAEACQVKRKACTRRQFQCAYGACIRKAKKCNKVIDCLDSSDESDETCGPRPDLPRPLRTSFSPSVKLIGSADTTTPTPEPKPVTKTPSTGAVIPANQKGCGLTGSLEVELEIAFCGDNSYCEEDVLPVNTLMIIFCGGKSTPLRCKDDNMWYFERDPLRAPRINPCGDGREPSSLSGTPTVLHPKIKAPSECGNLPPFQPNPWIVGLMRGGEFACTGTIIASRLILTAAHCVVEPVSSTRAMPVDNLKIQHNSNGPSGWASVSVIEIFPGYTGGNSPHFDVALLFLKEEISASAACLDSQGTLLNIPAWTFNRSMGQSDYSWQMFPQTFNTACYNLATACTRHLEIGSDQFCGYNKDSTLHLHRGSSGGPYLVASCASGVQKWTVAGVVSSKMATSGCGLPHTIFSQVSKFHAWIINCGFQDNCKV